MFSCSHSKQDGIVLCGQSAGAHIASLTVLKLASYIDSPDIVSRSLFHVYDDVFGKNQQQARETLAAIRLVVGMSGVYDIADHFKHEASRGVEYISPMGRALLGNDLFLKHSPSYHANLMALATRSVCHQKYHRTLIIIQT